MKKKLVSLFMAAAVGIGLLGYGAAGNVVAAEEAEESAEETAAFPQGEWKIALSNSYIGNGYRMQFVNTFVAYAEKLKEQGVIADYYQSSSGNDAQDQINEIRNMISEGYDAILINAASPTALIPIVEEAVERGIVVVTVDNCVDTDVAYKVEVDGQYLGKTQAEWIVDAIGGEGNVVILRGVEGTTIDRDRHEGVMSVLDQYPDINIIAEAYGNWDDATCLTELNNILAANTGTQIDAVLQQGGGENGVYEALIKNNIDLDTCYVTGDMTNGLYRHFLEDGLKGIGVAHPPYCSAVALNVAIAALNGEEPDSYTGIPSPKADYTEAESVYMPDYPDSAFVAYTDETNSFGITFEEVAADK